ncbi:MAG: transposase [Tannerella sp.]|nr:transposase [Tannerella sp.]
MNIDAATPLKFLNGVDVTQISGISELSTLAIYSEVGTDMSRWKNEKHFTSWPGLAPNTKISGGKIISSHVPKKKTPCRTGFSHGSHEHAR